MTWQKLHFPESEKIKHSRAQFHQAIQNVASVGRSLLPQVADDHNANLRWDNKVHRLVGRWIEIGDGKKFRSSIGFEDFSVYLVDQDYQTISSISLNDKKQSAVMVWLEEQFDLLKQDSSKLTLQLPYEIPEYPTSKGQPFHMEDDKTGILLGRYFQNTDFVLNELVSPMEGASDVRCWPHHFDIASLITLYDTGDPETSKSIGVGFSPGDENYDEPYFYITPWPYPNEEKLLPISGSSGFWHTDGWIGAILKGSSLGDDSSDQYKEVRNFISSGIDSLKSIL